VIAGDIILEMLMMAKICGWNMASARLYV